VKLVKDTPFEVAWLVWRIRPPKPSLTVVVKATFDLCALGDCPIAATQALPTGDELHDDEEGESLRYESDLAPLKLRGECLLMGTYRPPAGAAPAPTSAGLLFRVGPVNKRLALFGEREFTGLGGITPPAPITAIPLRWERAFGGPGSKANPLGRGLAPAPGSRDKVVRLPQIEQPHAPVVGRGDRPAPAATWPVPRGFAARASLTGTYDRKWLEGRWPWFPEDFDYDHFNAAPADQRIDGYFHGDEEIGLTGALPDLARVQCRLPGLRPRAYLEPQGGTGDVNEAGLREVPLALDTIIVDLDRRQVLGLWRGVAELDSDDLALQKRLFVKHEPLGAAATETPAAALRRVLAAQEQNEAPSPPPAALPVPPRASNPGGRGELEARWKTGASCAGLQLAGADLSALDLRGCDLSKAILTGANLRGARLEGAKLDGAILQDADLTGAAVAGVSLVGADLTACRGGALVFDGARLDDAIAIDAQLGGARFLKSSLTKTDLSGATLDKATFEDCDLSRADLSRARLDEAVFVRCRLVEAWMEGGVSAKRARLDDCELRLLRASDGGDFTEASFARADLAGARFSRSRLDRASFAFALLDDAQLAEAQLAGADLRGCKLRRARLPGANLADAALPAADLYEANLEGADLRRADLTGASLFRAELWQAQLEGATLEAADLTGTKLA
jgi:uncharacterized protein YjbI with pentapeptide repeats